jgi:hypothetical protein
MGISREFYTAITMGPRRGNYVSSAMGMLQRLPHIRPSYMPMVIEVTRPQTLYRRSNPQDTGYILLNDCFIHKLSNDNFNCRDFTASNATGRQ